MMGVIRAGPHVIRPPQLARDSCTAAVDGLPVIYTDNINNSRVIFPSTVKFTLNSESLNELIEYVHQERCVESGSN